MSQPVSQTSAVNIISKISTSQDNQPDKSGQLTGCNMGNICTVYSWEGLGLYTILLCSL